MSRKNKSKARRVKLSEQKWPCERDVICFSGKTCYKLRLKGSKKSASAPPRGGAREPGRQLLAFRQDGANRLPEQTQRRVYGSAARARRHGGGIMKIFHWEGEPQREFNTATTTSLRTL